MNKIRSTKGITLVALVVTIIILLILVGITIGALIGDNGLLNRAKDAKIATEIASIKEEIQTEILAEQAENQGNISDDTLTKILKKYGTLSDEENLKDKTLTTTKGNYEMRVADIWSGTTKNDEPKPPAFTTVANAPDTKNFAPTTTHYVSWDLTSSLYAINEKTNLSGTALSNWYDYTAGVNHWANVKTTGGGNECYWVWIPRYAYKVPTKSSNAETIEVAFLKDKGTTTNDIIDTNKKAEIEAVGGFKTIATPGNWVIHPAFTSIGNGGFGELEGIWVAKFEASSSSSSVVENPTVSQLAIDGGPSSEDKKSDGTTQAADADLKVRVRPNVTSWRGIIVNDIFTVCQNLREEGNSLMGTIGLDSHMMKNTEWGAVAYLSRSIYGKNSEVWNNPFKLYST